MARKALLTIRRGSKAQLPVLSDGELGYCTDTQELFIGTTSGNKFIGAGADMLKSIYDTNNDGVVDNADKANSVPWSGVTGKPSTFTPSSHSHSANDITEVTDKKFMSDAERSKLAGIEAGANKYTHPSTHPASMITGLPTSLPANGGSADSINFIDNRSVSEKPSQLNIKSKLSASFKNRTAVGNPPVGANSTYVYILNVAGWSSNEGSGGWPIQLAFGSEGMAQRQATDADTWGAWVKISNVSEMPTALSHLIKDINFDERYYTESEIDTKLSGKANSSHTHQATEITESTTKRFVTDSEKSTWNNKASTTVATTSANGLMSSGDKSKLDGIQAGANKYTHPSSHPASIITGLATVATSGSYNDLTNKPSIPAKTSQLSNDSGFITTSANVASATRLQTARKINGVSFDGTQDISISALGSVPQVVYGSYYGDGTNTTIDISAVSNPTVLIIRGHTVGIFIAVYGDYDKSFQNPTSIICIAKAASSTVVTGNMYGNLTSGSFSIDQNGLNMNDKLYDWTVIGA